ncbi:RNA polymerase sigma factor [Pedobacter hartonius]|uniref:RNA polymerase sigma-70 factor, ECF subfamily n=1 Tax=Pedobacter hartonius TaxID=425514 RepID=A0A1H4G3B2_9SPHI|nr:RNA polymerase sigma-70 factor [Pedobacter hartonius]SEB04079.1 RNA polymerase sigma-70 factor, ECF subfamily [Pedobacter hartonius]
METDDFSLFELLRLTGENDHVAFRQLYERYMQTVYMMVKRRVPDVEEAKDITQEIFIHLWNKRNELALLRNFDTWLYAIIRNKVISAYRRNSVKLQGEQFLIQGIEKLDWDAEDQIIAKELDQKIDNILSGLPETTRNCYQLSKKEGKKINEIAGMLNLSERTVRNNISEALRRLRVNLNGHYPELLALIIMLHHKH